MDILTTESSLFQYGIADAFIAGLYEGQLSTDELKKRGNFGIGAPNLIDGELTIVAGKVYQSNANGETFEAPAQLKTPFAFVTNFRAQTIHHLSAIQNINNLFEKIGALLPNPNSMYALHISGRFSKIRTCAFPKLVQKPFKPLSQLLDQQRFFDHKETDGEMIGFFMPDYLSGINITGLHFHFLSHDRKAGGHIVDLTAENLTLELAEIKGFYLQPPATNEFQQFKFIRGNSQALQKIEKGGD